MKARLSWLAAAFSLIVNASGCKDEGYTPPPAEPSLTLTASDPQVPADGTNFVTLTVTNTAGGQTVLTTARGTFPNGTTSYTVSEGSAAVTLTTCDAETVTGCAGPVVVTATSGSLQASVTIQFVTLAAACEVACGVDTQCAGRACLSSTGAGTCSATLVPSCIVSGGGGGGGGGGTDGPAITVTPERTRLPATGSATTDVVIQVTHGTTPTSGVAVTISTALGSLSATSGTTGSDGKVTVTFSAGTATGVATITATSTTPALSGSATITIPKPGAFQIDQASQYTVQGVKGSGWRELGWLQVQLLGDDGLPYPDGLTVRFEHRPLGGSTFSDPLVTTGTCTTWTGCVRYDATTTSGTGTADTAGLATAWLYSGTVAGTLETVVSATAGGVTRTAVLTTVAVVGAKANGASFSVVCSPLNVPALAETDCSISLVDEPFTCVALAKDRFGNVLGRPTQVIFGSEASAAFPVTTTPEYDPTSAAPQDLGTAVQRFQTLGAGLPFDVSAGSGETPITHGYDGCGSRVHNPRDGVVTIVAIADGEEAFFDVNGNGVYDRGSDTVGLTTSEPFVDQGEPFVDTNDNGQWDAGEWFFDRDGSLAYTPRNGTWDGDTKIWTQTVVVYTGAATTMMIPGVAPAPDTYLGTRWAADADFTDSCTATPAPANFSLPLPGAIVTAWYAVVASDMNLNQLHMRASYDVSLESGSLDLTYYGLPAYADDLGFFYRYWPCNQAVTPVCASQCRSTTNLPCVMTPSLSGFGCGIAAGAKVTCGTTAGANQVDFTVQTPYERYGTGKNAITTRSIQGSCN